MDKPLKRFTISLPINKNTIPHLDDLLSIVKEVFGGCTFSRFHLPALKIKSQKIKGYFIGRFEEYHDEEVCFIIFDVDLNEYSNVYDDISALINIIRDSGEKAVWLTYHDIMLTK